MGGFKEHFKPKTEKPWFQKKWDDPVWSKVIAGIIVAAILTGIAFSWNWFCEIVNTPAPEYISLEYEITDENGIPTQGVQLMIRDSIYFLNKNNSEILIPDKNDSVVSITYSKPGYKTIVTNHNLYFPLDISLRKPVVDE